MIPGGIPIIGIGGIPGIIGGIPGGIPGGMPKPLGPKFGPLGCILPDLKAAAFLN
jgi:hypothetical protein